MDISALMHQSSLGMFETKARCSRGHWLGEGATACSRYEIKAEHTHRSCTMRHPYCRSLNHASTLHVVTCNDRSPGAVELTTLIWPG